MVGSESSRMLPTHAEERHHPRTRAPGGQASWPQRAGRAELAKLQEEERTDGQQLTTEALRAGGAKSWAGRESTLVYTNLPLRSALHQEKVNPVLSGGEDARTGRAGCLQGVLRRAAPSNSRREPPDDLRFTKPSRAG